MKSARRAVALTATALNFTAATAIPAVGHANPGDCTHWEWPSSVVIRTSDGWVLSGRGLGSEARDFSITAVPPAMSPIMNPGMYLDGSLNTNSPNRLFVTGQLSLRGSSERQWSFSGNVRPDGQVSGFIDRGEFSVDGKLFCTAKE